MYVVRLTKSSQNQSEDFGIGMAKIYGIDFL